MKKFAIILTTLFILITLSANVSAQGSFGRIGKRFSKDKAVELYGPVKNSIKLETSKLAKILEKSGNYTLFLLKKGELKIYNSKRIELYPVEGNAIDEKEPLRVFSTSMVLETINSGASGETYIENRENVLTITNGETTLEYAVLCPPLCD